LCHTNYWGQVLQCGILKISYQGFFFPITQTVSGSFFAMYS